MASLRQRQALATRSAILRAAQERFESDGYEAAGIEDIAAAAGVAMPTVYKVFTNKRKLLAAVVEAAMPGDVDAPVAEQPWWREQITEPNAARQLRLIARNARQIYDRAGLLLELLRSAAREPIPRCRPWYTSSRKSAIGVAGSTLGRWSTRALCGLGSAPRRRQGRCGS